MEATHIKDGLFLSQSKYIDDILTRADMLQVKSLHTPVSVGSSLSKHDDPLSDLFLYRSIVGALQYLTLTRPEPLLSIELVNSCKLLHLLIGERLNAFFDIFVILLVMGSFFVQIHNSLLLPTLMLTGQDVPMIVVQQLDFVFF
ncbi:uncharacterized mitochondrial protein AtMg00810-like [Impatiens glandulifera]|uniref:uncharacterized mitochondrial protein AtMg00810-like n=1 Tax=Impatiens glandulifera TaxID=253017 RepID=UPI001FB15FA4|nr:uncharacterized mitochondrial protein AtMg00810-like [Impatiens glandulifera]